MTIGSSLKQFCTIGVAAALLLASPANSRAHGYSLPAALAFPLLQNAQDKAEQDEKAREREEARREREEAERDRQQEARDREQDRLDRMDDLYQEGRDALEEDRYDRAEAKFGQLADMNGPQTDAALYWKAYAENKQGKRDVALATIGDLKRKYPQSRWQKDASALEIEVRQSNGTAARPENQPDDDLRMLAIHGLMNSDPERALPLLEKVLNGSGSPKEKSKALFVIAQSGSPQGREIIGKVARGQSNPDLQRKAVEYLGIFGGTESRKILADVYASASDASIKRAILRSYMIGGDREHLFSAAKSEKDEGLRMEAIRQLGLVHGTGELEQLYKTEASPNVRRELLQAFFLAGESGRLFEAAQGEKDPELRRAAIRNLGLINSGESGKDLQGLYAKEADRGIREEILNAFFLQGNAAALVAIARNEKDPSLKRTAVSKLSLMNSKEATDYLMELLQK
jgi:HEAT repeat protein